MSINHPKIARILTMDMTSDERRTFYAVEWQTENGGHYVDVYSTEDGRDLHALSMVEMGKKSVVIYDVIAPFHNDADDALDFVKQVRDIE
jgi:hypothetical protein